MVWVYAGTTCRGVLLGQQLIHGELHTGRVAQVAQPVGESQLLALCHEVHCLSGLGSHARQVEALGQGELLEQDVALGYRGLLVDGVAPIVDLDRFQQFGPAAGEVLPGQETSLLLHGSCDSVRDGAAVESIGASFLEGSQGAGELRLLQDLSLPVGPTLRGEGGQPVGELG